MDVAISGEKITLEHRQEGNESRYHLIMKLSVSYKPDLPSGEAEVRVPISEQDYDYLIRQLKESTAQKPRIVTNGKLELKIGATTLN